MCHSFGMTEIVFWHWPHTLWLASALFVGAVATAAVGISARSLALDARTARERAGLWRMAGWGALAACAMLGAAAPGWHTAASLRVRPDGTWEIRSPFGVRLAEIASSAPRTVRGIGLGGLGRGTGRIEIRADGGRAWSTPRVTRDGFDGLRESLGIARSGVRDELGDCVIPQQLFVRGVALAGSAQ